MGRGVKFRTCLQKGAPACPYLYEEHWEVSVPNYVWISAVEGTMVLQEMERRLVGYSRRLHIGLHGCLLGLGHVGGHLIDMHGGSRWRISDIEEDDVDA
jgi:hypothetical protein